MTACDRVVWCILHCKLSADLIQTSKHTPLNCNFYGSFFLVACGVGFRWRAVFHRRQLPRASKKQTWLIAQLAFNAHRNWFAVLECEGQPWLLYLEQGVCSSECVDFKLSPVMGDILCLISVLSFHRDLQRAVLNALLAALSSGAVPVASLESVASPVLFCNCQ